MIWATGTNTTEARVLNTALGLEFRIEVVRRHCEVLDFFVEKHHLRQELVILGLAHESVMLAAVLEMLEQSERSLDFNTA